MRVSSIWLGLAAAAAAVFFACGGSGDATSEEALKKRVKESAEAIFQGEARAAYNTYSEECQDEVTLSEFRSALGVAAAFFEGFAGVKLEDLEVEEVKIRNFKDDSAEAAIVVRAKDGEEVEGLLGDEDEYVRWEVEDGQWVIADCSDMGFGTDGDDDDGDRDATATVVSPGRTPTAAPTAGPKPKLGQTTEVGAAKYTVNAIQDNLPGSEFSKPPAGKRWLAIDVTIEATGEVSYNPYDFSLQDADAFVYEPTFVSGDAPAPDLSSGDLARGDRVRGWVFFEVPATAKLTSVRVTPDFGKPAAVIADLATP